MARRRRLLDHRQLATVTGTGTHQLHTPRSIDAVGNRTSARTPCRSTTRVPADDDRTPGGWQHGHVNVTVEGTDAHSGVDHVEWELDAQPSAPAPPAPRSRSATASTTLKTRVIDDVGNATAWTTHPVQVDIAGPVDTTVVPTGWVTTADEVTSTSPAPTRRLRRQAHRVGARTATTHRRRPRPGPVPVTVSGDGVHNLEMRLTDGQADVLRLAHAVRQDRHRQPDRQHDRRGRLAAARVTSTSPSRGTDVHSQVAARRVAARRRRHRTASSAARRSSRLRQRRAHARDAGRRQRRQRAAPGSRTRSSSTPALPTNMTPTVPTGWRNTPYTVTLNGTDGGSDVASVNYGSRSRASRRVPSWRARATSPRSASPRRHAHARAPACRDNAGNYSAWRAETVRIDRVLADRRHVLSGRAGRQRPHDHLRPAADAAPASPRSSGSSTAVPSRRRRRRRSRARARTRCRRACRTTPATGATGRPARSRFSSASEDTTAPTDTTVVPTNWQHRRVHDHRHRRRTTSTAPASTTSSGATATSRSSRARAAATFTITDGRRARDRDARDRRRRQRVAVAPPDAARSTARQPTDTQRGRRRAGRTRARSPLRATDATSGVASDRVQDRQRPARPGRRRPPTRHAPRRRRRTRSATASSTTRARPRRWTDRRRQGRHGQPDATRAAAAPTTWQTSALSLALTGTDAASGVDHAEWRVDGGDVADRHARAGRRPRARRRSRRGSSTRPATPRRGARRRPGRPHQAGQHDAAPVTAPWRKTNFTTTVTGTDATPGSGVARIEYKLDNGAVTTTPAVSITAAGSPHARDARASTSPATRPTGAPTRSASTRPTRRCP